jgi:hypothetical protein
MKTRLLIIIVAVVIAVFVIWSASDTVCKPCIIPSDAPDNYVCATVCHPEPRWYSWIRG